MTKIFIKYPRTQSLPDNLHCNEDLVLTEGSVWVIEEKMDGTQLGLSFDKGKPIVQSRGHLIANEEEFSLFKAWVWEHYEALQSTLGERFILFGEWLYAKHTIYYDCLPDYFLEFDIYDHDQDRFLSTCARQHLLKGLDFIHSVRMIKRCNEITFKELQGLISNSAFISNRAYNQLNETEQRYTEQHEQMEGLYIKMESEHFVLDRYKWVRPEFVQFIVNQGEHWRSRELTLNQRIRKPNGT